jgi:CheY-like chemotaxis protein
MKSLWLVDDDSTFRYVFRRIVESHDLVDQFFEFENGDDAYQELIHRLDNQQQPDWIFLDISMPVLDGWGFLEKLSALQSHDLKTKIYLISSSIAASHQSSDERFPLLAGCVTKPISVDKIYALL